ncbi:SHOCT domain-containing protein [Flavobacterium sp. j3]|uniref:SHOCT domain-containing protein n=1 Tax=Flavobacterium aureirubrum TaxID=3133147 RepID=A0ABU9N6T3_9FLAO
MNDNIAVGILVGLATGTSLYVWNSNSFTKVQKIGLVCCIIFPPLQWISILLVLAINKYQAENTTEAKTIRQNIENKQNLDSAKNNLIELKEKGIITDDEFNSKVDKIENQKKELDIKNSIEYRQLKSLLDSGIITIEEFDDKIEKTNLFFVESKIETLAMSSKKIIGVWRFENETFEFWLTGYFVYKTNNIKVACGSWLNKNKRITINLKDSSISILVLNIENNNLKISVNYKTILCEKIKDNI